MEDERLIELTNNLYQVIVKGDTDFIEKSVAEKLQWHEIFFGKKYKKEIERKQVFETLLQSNFRVPSNQNLLVYQRKGLAKVICEARVGIHLSNVKFRNGFARKTFFYVKTQGNWQLVKFENNLTWFSKNDFLQSFFNLLGSIIKRDIDVRSIDIKR